MLNIIVDWIRNLSHTPGLEEILVQIKDKGNHNKIIELKDILLDWGFDIIDWSILVSIKSWEFPFNEFDKTYQNSEEFYIKGFSVSVF